MRATKMALLLGTCGLLLVACDDNGPLPGVFVDGGTNADANGGSPGRGGSSGSGTGGGAGGTAGQGGAGGTAGQGGAGGTTMTGQGGAGGGMTGAGGGTAGAGGGTAGTGGTVGTGSGGRGGAGTGGTGGVVGGGVGASCGGFRPAPVPGCKAGLFCELKPDTCNIIADAPGTCAEIPNACTLEYNPVCGCDNMTYGNDCARRAAGVSRANTGPCKTAPGVSKACGGIAGIACASGLFCELREGTCGAADQPGICQAVPDACTKEYAPVCGCDGVTYGNDCMRRAAGVAKKANGAC